MKFKIILIILILVLPIVNAEIKDFIKIDENIKIEFSEIENLEKSEVEFLSAIKSDKFKISIDTDNYPELNKPAKIIFKNCNLKNPVVLYNGIYAPFVKISKEKGDCIINVNHFSTWSLIDNTFNGTFYSTTIYYNGLGKEKDKVLSLNFDDNNTLDYSVYNLNFTLNGTKNWFNISNDGQLYFQDSSNFLTYYDSNDYFNLNNFTNSALSIMVRFNTSDSAAQFVSRRSTFGWNAQITAGKLDVFSDTLGGNSNCMGNTFVNDSVPHTAIFIWNKTGKYSFLDGSLDKSCLGIFLNSINQTGLNVRIGASSVAASGNYIGFLSSVIILDRTATTEEILLYNQSFQNDIYLKYVNNGTYVSEVYNHSDYDTQIYTNTWEAIIFPSELNASILGRAGNCSLINSLNWSTGVKSGQNFTFPNQQGNCFQYNLTLFKNSSDSDIINQVNITSLKHLMPMIFNISISPTIPTNDITCTALFLLNDTEQGEINFTFYKNDVLFKSFLKTNLTNGTFSSVPITANDYVPGDRISCSAYSISNSIISINTLGSELIKIPASGLANPKKVPIKFNVTIDDMPIKPELDKISFWAVAFVFFMLWLALRKRK